MKSKLMLTMLALTLAISLVAGGTMAWFTATDPAGNAVFTAGTVQVIAGVANILPSSLNEENVNPGDCFEVEWTIENAGSKKMVFMADLSASWENLVSGHWDGQIGNPEVTMANLTLKIWDGTTFVDPKATGINPVDVWMLEGSGNNLNNYKIYYVGPALEGTDSDGNVTDDVTLKIQICFDGPTTHNGYQGAKFTLGGTVTAVQATNGAPNDHFVVDYYDYLGN